MIPGYTHITTKTFEIDDKMLIVSIYFNPDEAASLRPIWEVTTRFTDEGSCVLELYRGTNWFRAYYTVYDWHERRYKRKLEEVMKSVDVMDNYAVDVIKEARK